MATTFAETAIKFVADSSALKPQLAGIERQLGEASERMASAVKTGILAMTAAIATATTALALVVKGVADAGDEINKLSQRVGIGAEILSGYKLAAQLSDLSLQDFATSMQKLSRNMVEASRGTGEAQEAFKLLGISVTGAGGKLKTAEQVMLEIADKFAKMEDGAQKTALVLELFGKAGAAMLPFLNQGTKALAEQREEAKLFGATFNAIQAKTAEEFNDTLTRIGAAVKGFATMVGNYLLPLANEVLGALLAKLKELAESGQLRIWAVQTSEAIVRGFVWAAQAVGTLAQASTLVVDGFRLILAAFRTLETGLEQAIGGMLKGIEIAAGVLAKWDELKHPFTGGTEWSKGLREIEKSAHDLSATFTTASKQAADLAVGWWEAIGTSNAGAEAFAKKLDGMAKSVEDWAGRAMAASIKAAAGIGETGKAATTAAGKWETLEFQVDGVTKSLRVWTAEVSKALPTAAASALQPVLGAPTATKPAGPGSMAGILTRAAAPLEEGEERQPTGREWAASIGSTWEEVVRTLAGSERRDLLPGIMQRFGTEGDTPVLSADLVGGLGSGMTDKLGNMRTELDTTITWMEERVSRGIQFIDQRLPQAVEEWFVRRLESELKRQ